MKSAAVPDMLSVTVGLLQDTAWNRVYGCQYSETVSWLLLRHERSLKPEMYYLWRFAAKTVTKREKGRVDAEFPGKLNRNR